MSSTDKETSKKDDVYQAEIVLGVYHDPESGRSEIVDFVPAKYMVLHDGINSYISQRSDHE